MKTSPIPMVTSITVAVLVGMALPAYGAGANCAFGTTPGLAFGNLDPSLGAQAVATASVQVGDCQGGSVGLLSVTVASVLSPGSPKMYLNGVVEPDSNDYQLSAVTITPTNTAPGNGQYRN